MEVGPMRTHTHFQGAFKVLLLSSSPKYFSKWNSRTGKNHKSSFHFCEGLSLLSLLAKVKTTIIYLKNQTQCFLF